jgi:hypothetical protein
MDLTSIVRITIWVIGVGTIFATLVALFEGWSRTRIRGHRPTVTVTVETGERITLRDFTGSVKELNDINRAISDIAAQHRRGRFGILWGGLGAGIGAFFGLIANGVLLLANLKSAIWSGIFGNAWIAFLAVGALVGGLIGRRLGVRKDRSINATTPSKAGANE